MRIKIVLQKMGKIRSYSLSKIMRKISSRIKRNYDLFLYRHVGKIPKAEVWQGQWLIYKKIKRKYLDVHYDLKSIFPRNSDIPDEKNIWVYWNDDIELAPDLVKKCYKQLQKNKPENYRLILISQQNIQEYVHFPSFIMDKVERKIMSQAHFADIIRTALIYKYGGIWMDATCLLTSKIPEKILNSDFFVFQATLLDVYSPIKNSNWFIAANKRNCKILERMLQVLLYYWERNNRILHYFLYHIIMSTIVETDPECYKIWKKMPYICNMNPHVMQYSFYDEFSEAQWNNIIESCFVHKLTYKYDNKALSTTKKNILQHVMDIY